MSRVKREAGHSGWSPGPRSLYIFLFRKMAEREGDSGRSARDGGGTGKIVGSHGWGIVNDSDELV